MHTAQHEVSIQCSNASAIADSERKLLSFRLGSETFAIPVERVKEIIELGGVTRVPMTPAHFRGVLNLRGSVVPVVDLAVRLGRGASADGRRTCIVVLELRDGDEPLDIGVVVDAVNDVFDITGGELQGAPSFGASVPGEFIAGMIKVGERFVVLLDETTTLSPDDLSGVVGESGTHGNEDD